ncbi:MAG: FG-GAP-like repeat-containing protein [Alphaproteobacteria bacterium]|nr:FG-GAP-like repeat-containing protein [Alphaproteobacteria bacterium]
MGSTSSGSGDEGEVIIFDGSSLQTTMDSTNIDTTITGDEDNGFFGTSLATGNIIGDSGIDLLVGASQQGTAYVIDKNTIGSITADNADIVMSGVGLNNRFGRSVGIGDFDGDGDQDIAVGATGVTTGGATYIFYNIGTATPFPSSASSADVTIATSGSDFIDFGAEIATGDFDKDSKTDLAIADNNDDSNIVIIILGEGLTGVSDINLGTGAVS